MNILTIKEKKRITAMLQEEYGISSLPYTLIQFGKERLKIFSGDFDRDTLVKLDHTVRIEQAGLYVAREHDGGLRLTIDGVHFFHALIQKNVLEISVDQMKSWLSGENLDIPAEKGFVVLKHGDDFLGCGKSSGNVILNSIPKERRLRG